MKQKEKKKKQIESSNEENDLSPRFTYTSTRMKTDYQAIIFHIWLAN